MTIVWNNLLIFILSTINCYTIKNQNQGNNTLVLIHVISRHGARIPDSFEIYPKDPYANLTLFAEESGQLTNYGKMQEFDIGKALRKNYHSFLGKYSRNTFMPRSTDMERTKASCELISASLYPPTIDQRWNEFLDWQPIPYSYSLVEYDDLLGNRRFNCPKFEKAYYDYVNSLEGNALNDKNKNLYEYLSRHTGWEINGPRDVYDLYFSLKSEETLGLTLPEWTRPVWPKQINDVAVEEYHISTATPQMRRMTGGYLLREIVNNTKQLIEGNTTFNRTTHLYCCHEFNIAQFLLLLNIFNDNVPPFGAYVVVETHKIAGVYGFKILYQDYSTVEPKVLKLPDCEEFCPFDEFEEIVRQYFPQPEDTC